MLVAVEVAGWLLLVAAVAGVLLNARGAGRERPRHGGSTTRTVVLACMVGAGALLALTYAVSALGLGDTLIESGRRGGSLWVAVVVFALLAVAGLRAWRKGSDG